MKEPETVQKFDTFQIDELISMGLEIDDNIKNLTRDLNYIKWLIYQQLRAKDAKRYPSNLFEAEIKFKDGGYNYNKLYHLLEMIPEEDIKAAHTPEHKEEVTVQAKWDGRVLRRLKGYGGEIKQIIEEAELPDEPVDIILRRK